MSTEWPTYATATAGCSSQWAGLEWSNARVVGAVARVLEPKPLVRWRLERYKGRRDPWLPTPPVAKIRGEESAQPGLILVRC